MQMLDVPAGADLGCRNVDMLWPRGMPTARLEAAFDERYITALRDRDPQVEAHFVAQFKTPIWVKARRQLGALDLAEDACQETLLRVLQYFRSGKRLENPARLPAFVQSVCHNITLEMIRSKTRYRQMPDAGEDPRDPASDPYAALVTQERKQLVREILARLSEKDRDLLRLAMLEEMDKAELCRRFRVTEEYLRVLLYRARMHFRDELLKREGACGAETWITPGPRLVRRSRNTCSG